MFIILAAIIGIPVIAALVAVIATISGVAAFVEHGESEE